MHKSNQRSNVSWGARRTMTSSALALSLAASCSAASEPTAQNEQLPTTHALIDQGYSAFPTVRADVNGDGLWDYCRFVGDWGQVFISCALQGPDATFPDETQYAFNSIVGIDLGYDDMPREFHDVDANGLQDFCRFVGDHKKPFLSCNLARDYGFDTDQYTMNSPPVHRGDSGRFLDIDSDGAWDFCQFDGANGAKVWTQCCNYNRSDRFSPEYCIDTDGFGNPIHHGSGGTHPVPDSAPINQPFQATCRCTLDPDDEDSRHEQTKTLCFSRGQEEWRMAAAANQSCVYACDSIANHNWETMEGGGPQAGDFQVLSGDCVQTGANAGFQF